MGHHHHHHHHHHQQPDDSWLEGSWGITFPVFGGARLDAEVAGGLDPVSGAQEIVDELSEVGHVITNLSYFAHSHYFTLSQNNYINIRNEIHPDVVPSAANDDIIFDVLDIFKNSDKKIILYISTQYFARADEDNIDIKTNWDQFVTQYPSQNDAYVELLRGFVEVLKDYADGYWLDTVTANVEDIVDMIREVDPTAVVTTNKGKDYIRLDDGTKAVVASNGVSITGETSPKVGYNIIRHTLDVASTTQDFTNGHVTSIIKAPTDSWGYEEFTVGDMIEEPYTEYLGNPVIKHAWFPVRYRWHTSTRELLYDTERSYRTVKSIIDAGASVTLANTVDYNTGRMMPDEMVMMKEVNRRLLLNEDCEAYTRPAGARLEGEVFVPVTGVSVSPSSVSLDPGDTQSLSSTVSPSNASTSKVVIWSSSNTSVATVNSSGEVTAIAGGTATIRGRTLYGGFIDSCTVTVTGGTGGTTNLALNGTATQSTTLAGAVASRANDGDTNGNFGGNSVSAAEGPNAWWEVDLGDNYEIDDINVFNRTNNCCSSRLSDFTVSVINSGGTTTFTQTITTAPNPSVTLDAGGVTGQVVRIQSNLTTTLNLAEVEVYGSESSKLDQTITFNLPAKQLGDADFDPATASSGYNISYTSSNTNVATIVNGNIRIVGVGTSEITASQAGNVVYNPAPSVTRTLVVTDGNTGGTTNLALNGTATQSTTLGGAEASRAIDGDTNGNFSGGSISAAEGPNAWWEVDLGGNYNIDDINVFNRTNNCCSSRLSDFTVSVINSSGTTTYTQTITTAPNPSVTLDAGGAVGQVVRIQSNLTTTLNLAEVEVYGSQSNTNNTITIQENTTGFCDVDGVIQSADAGYTGSGYANTSNALGRAIDWEIDGTAGSYTFVWRYLVGSARTADLIVDGTTVATGISFVNTQGGWLTAEATVGLGAGVKSVILSSTSSTGLAKIDYLEVTGPNVVASACASSSLKTSLDLKAPDTDTEDILHF
nr:endo-alpha1,3-fucoidanase [synthetic construct]